VTTALDAIPWHTAPEHAGLHERGWLRLPSGVEITARPLVDETGDAAWARLTYRDALIVVARLGGRLPTRAEVIETIAHARAHGVVLAPVTLSHGPEMVTLAHAQEHDGLVAQQLRGAIVAGIGKHWVAGAAPGRSRICGWPRADGSLWQAGTKDVHGDDHHDYATTTLVVRDVEIPVDGAGVDPIPPSVDPVRDTDPAPAPTWDTGLDGSERLGLRALAWLGYQAQLAPREIPGPRHNDLILSYSRACRRGGTLLGVTREGTPIWSGGSPLPLSRDEEAWCAALVSATLLAALRPGDVPPHGLRVSVRELVEDARVTESLRLAQDPATGEWHLPRPGDLGIDARAGGDPLLGGTGHVFRVLQVVDGLVLGIGGNELDGIQIAWRPLRAPERRGWIVYP
jgi:hypothetical protein